MLIFDAIKYLIYVLFILAFLIFIFMSASPAFGAPPNKDSRKLIESSKNFVAGKFVNLKSDYKNVTSRSGSSDKSATLMDWIFPPKDKKSYRASSNSSV